MDRHMLFDMRHDYISLNFRNEKKCAKKLLFGAKKSHNRWFFRFFYLESHRIRLITN